MKKSIAILLSMCLIFGLFTACGGTAPAAEASASAPAPQEEAASAGTPAEEAQPEPAAEAEPQEISAQEIAEETEPEIVHLVEFPIEESFSISVSRCSISSPPRSRNSAMASPVIRWPRLAKKVRANFSSSASVRRAHSLT